MALYCSHYTATIRVMLAMYISVDEILYTVAKYYSGLSAKTTMPKSQQSFGTLESEGRQMKDC
jgi:hypothetical protein